METRIAIAHGKARYSIQAATKRLPPDVDKTVFLTLMNHCLPGRRGITENELQRLVTLARNFQRLPAKQQLVLLLKATQQNDVPKQPALTAKVSRDPVEQEVWIKERVSEATLWIRDLKRLGVSSASSYIFAGRHGAPKPPKDWANEVLNFHYCQELMVQDSVAKHLVSLDNAFVQLPDRRWHIKYQGEAIPPLADKGGLSCIYSLIQKNHLDRIVVRDEERNPYCLFMPTSSALGDPRKERNHLRLLERNNLNARCPIKTFDAARGNQGDDGGQQRVVNGRSNPEDKQIARAIAEIGSHNSRIAHALNAAIAPDSNGVLSFKDPNGADWVTEIPQLPGDALLEKTQSGWRVRIPLTDETIEVPPDREKGMFYIARLLQQTGTSVPVGLMANSHLLNSLVDRPPYQKLFKRTLQRLVKLTDNEFDPGTRAIIDAVQIARGYRSKYYEITHVIPKDSPLAKFMRCGLVSLTPDGLGGILHLLKKQLAASTLDGSKTPELLSLVDHMDRSVKYVTRYEGLASEIEPESNAARDKVQKAIASAIQHLWDIGEQSLCAHLEKYINTGKLCSYNGPWLWEVRGISQFPDVIELARDHIYMKLRRFARQNAGLSDPKHKSPQQRRAGIRLR